MNNELKLELYQHLNIIKDKNEKLYFKFEVDAGERIVQFYDKRKKVYKSPKLWRELSNHLKYILELTNNQNYYSDGQGEIFIKDENELRMTYDKYSFYDNDDLERNYKLDVRINTVPKGKTLLEAFKLSQISFYGEIWLKKEMTSKFEIYIHNDKKNKYLNEIREIKRKLEKIILKETETEVNFCKEISYSGKINPEIFEIKIEERKYVVYEDFSEEKNLFKLEK